MGIQVGGVTTYHAAPCFGLEKVCFQRVRICDFLLYQGGPISTGTIKLEDLFLGSIIGSALMDKNKIMLMKVILNLFFCISSFHEYERSLNPKISYVIVLL